MTDKELLKLAGKVAMAARALVGGNGLNGPVPACRIDRLGAAVDHLREALDAYDAAILAAGPAAEAPAGVCRWKQDEDDHSQHWSATCGDAWTTENGMAGKAPNFCPGCGRKVEVKP